MVHLNFWALCTPYSRPSSVTGDVLQFVWELLSSGNVTVGGDMRNELEKVYKMLNIEAGLTCHQLQSQPEKNDFKLDKDEENYLVKEEIMGSIPDQRAVDKVTRKTWGILTNYAWIIRVND